MFSFRKPEFELERNELYDFEGYADDYNDQRRGRSRFFDAEIMNPEFCDPGIWVFTLVVIIVGWVYLLVMGGVWFYFFCYKVDVDVTRFVPTEVVYLERQKSIQSQKVNANIYT